MRCWPDELTAKARIHYNELSAIAAARRSPLNAVIDSVRQ
jgi:hypothetical protein